jgi:predicted nucleic acid-binding protein
MATGSRFNFADASKKFPSDIVLDTSVLLHIIKPRPNNTKELRLHNDAKIFFQRAESAITRKEAVVYLPLHVITEAFRWIAVQETRQITNTSSIEELKKRIKSDPTLLTKANVINKISAFLGIIDRIRLFILQAEDLSFLAQENNITDAFENIMTDYIEDLLLLPDDAHIVATAHYIGVDNIASLDRDFLAVVNKGFNIYTSSNI